MPSIYSYANKSALGLEHLSTFKRQDRHNVSFSKQKSRDNQMYNITEGYRMDREDDQFKEKLDQLRLNHVEYCSDRRRGSIIDKTECLNPLHILRSRQLSKDSQYSQQVVVAASSIHSESVQTNELQQKVATHTSTSS